ncbi:MAG TPA: hypothetical protein VE997_04325 [Candidatus Limnocylindria bacterium]|jgi:hypothetical protein|nr:hypothetical protein [Candidatus Limnocylindria bacterium]
MNELELTLTSIGLDLSYPPTPDLRGAVTERVRYGPTPRRAPTPRTLALAAAVLLLVAAGATAAVPGARHAVLDWLGLRSVRVERVPKLPALPPGRAGGDLALGRRTTLAGARSRVSFPVLVPALGPGEVYVAATPPGGRVTLAYAPRPGLPRASGTRAGMLITEFRGEQPTGFIEKTLGPGTIAERVTVNGDLGVWIAGRPHQVLYEDARGQIRPDTLRLAGNTLLWRHGSVLLRLEAHVSKAAALRIARSMR